MKNLWILLGISLLGAGCGPQKVVEVKTEETRKETVTPRVPKEQKDQDATTDEEQMEMQATSMLQSEQLDKAIEIYEALSLKNPQNPKYPFEIGKILVLKKDYEGAQKQFQKCLVVKNTFVEAKIAMGYVALEAKQYRRAEMIFNGILAKDPSNKEARIGLQKVFQAKL